MNTPEEDIASALRAQRSMRLRAKAQARATTELRRRHRDEYDLLYAEAKKTLEAE